MSKGLRDKWIMSIPIPEEWRARLLSKFEPAHPLVFCERITVAYGVPKHFRADVGDENGQVLVTIHSYHRNINCDGFLCEVGGSTHQSRRPGESFSRLYHLTLSTIRGVSPSIAGLPADMGGLDDGRHTALVEPLLSDVLRIVRMPLRQRPPREIIG